MLWLILLTLAVVLIYCHLKKPFNFWKERGVPQTNPWPLLGDDWPMILSLKSRNENIEWLYNLFPDKRYFGAYTLTKPALVIKDPELIKKITVKDFDHFTDHVNAINPSDADFSSKVLFFQKGNFWKDVRSTMTGVFTSSKMRYMFGTIKATSEEFVNHFDQQNKDFLEVEMKDAYSRFANDVIASIAFGIESFSFKNPKNEFYLLGERFFGGNLSFVRQLLITLKGILPSFLFKVIIKLAGGAFKNPKDYFVDIIYETIEAREKNNIKRNDMINLLLEIKHSVVDAGEKAGLNTGHATAEESDIGKTVKKQRLVDVDNTFIAAQSLLFFFAGFDTMATALSFGTYELAFHSVVQARLREEIKETLDECNGSVTYDALLKMKYLDMVVSEILRKWHPSPAPMDRVCTKPYTLEAENPDEKNVTLKEGQIIWLPYAAIQKDAKYWPEPEKFDPERFSVENKGNIVPYTYFPFGVGPRNCIGNRLALLELKCMLFHVLHKYEFVPTDKTEVPLKLVKGIGMHNTAANGFWLGMRRVEA